MGAFTIGVGALDVGELGEGVGKMISGEGRAGLLDWYVCFMQEE